VIRGTLIEALWAGPSHLQLLKFTTETLDYLADVMHEGVCLAHSCYVIPFPPIFLLLDTIGVGVRALYLGLLVCFVKYCPLYYIGTKDEDIFGTVMTWLIYNLIDMLEP